MAVPTRPRGGRRLRVIAGSGTSARSGRWHWPPRRADLVLLAVLVWLVLCGITLRRAGQAAEGGLVAARAAEELSSPADILSGRAAAALNRATDAFGRARGGLRSPIVAPLRLLPVIGRQLRSSTALVSAAAEVSRIGGSAVDGARRTFEAPHATGPERVGLLRRLADIAADADRRLGQVQLGPDRALIGLLADKRGELGANIAEVRDVLGRARTVSNALASLLEGPSRYLVLSANNAEMRAGSGMFLSIGEAQMSGGSVALGDFRPAGAASLAPGTEPPLTDIDLAARWGWLSPNREWRNLATTFRFDATASLAAEMWAASGQGAVDGVLAVDPIALQAILSATGPVEVAGRTVGAADVVDLLLHDQYRELTDFDDQTERRELLGSIAGAAMEALQSTDVDLARLAEGLAAAARGRHLLAWSARPVDAGGWASAGMDGRLRADSLALAVLNRGGNKLDRFLEVGAAVAMTSTGTDTAFELEIRLANRVPAGESQYVAGPHPDSGVGVGVYLGLVSVNVPATARVLRVDGFTTLAASGADGPTNVAAVPVTIPPGGDIVVRVRFTMPGRRGTLRIEPSARVPPVRWTGPGGSWTDDGAHTLRW